MKLVICSVYDKGTFSFGRPFAVAHWRQAVRSLEDQVNNPEGGDLNKHPHDFRLIEVAEFNDQDGTFTFPASAQTVEAGALKLTKE